MKLSILAFLIVLIIGTVIARNYQYDVHAKEIESAAIGYNLVPNSKADEHFTSIGTPFNYVGKNMTITSLVVVNKSTNREGVLYIRHGWSNDIIAVFDGVETVYK